MPTNPQVEKIKASLKTFRAILEYGCTTFKAGQFRDTIKPGTPIVKALNRLIGSPLTTPAEKAKLQGARVHVKEMEDACEDAAKADAYLAARQSEKLLDEVSWYIDVIDLFWQEKEQAQEEEEEREDAIAIAKHQIREVVRLKAKGRQKSIKEKDSEEGASTGIDINDVIDQYNASNADEYVLNDKFGNSTLLNEGQYTFLDEAVCSSGLVKEIGRPVKVSDESSRGSPNLFRTGVTVNMTQRRADPPCLCEEE